MAAGCAQTVGSDQVAETFACRPCGATAFVGLGICRNPEISPGGGAVPARNETAFFPSFTAHSVLSAEMR